MAAKPHRGREKGMNIPVTKAIFGEEEVEAIRQTLESGWVVQGPRVAQFEKMWSEFSGAAFSRATTSCTTALHLALLALGIGPGDEVIVPAFTWVATANAVEYCGAKAVLCDIDIATFNIDPAKIEEKITPQTKAIMPVHEFGLSADMNAIMALAHKHKLKVVEDGACACGALYDGKHVGTFGDLGCFSFHPRKAITTGEGGMITTNNESYVAIIDELRSHGAQSTDLARHQSSHGFILPEFNRLGYNYRMTDIQGAIGIEQMKRVRGILADRRRLASRYKEMLAGQRGIDLPLEPNGCTHVYQSFTLLVKESNEERNRIALDLQSQGIATRQGTHAVHALGYYKRKYNLVESDCPQAWKADQQSMTLPLYATMTEEEQDYVVEALVKALG